MVSAKILCVLLVALVGTQAAPKHESRDFRVVIQNAIKVARIIGDAVDQGIKDATPAIQAIEAEMNADLAAQVHGVLIRVQTDVENVIAKIQELETTVTKAMSDIAAAAPGCQDTAETDLEPILNKYGGVLSALIKSVGDDNREDLDDLYASGADIGARLHELNINSVTGGVKCVQGKKEVKTCLDANGVTFTDGIASLLADGVLFLNEAKSVVNTTLTAFQGGLQPELNNTRNAADLVFADFGTCVEKS